ncbi:MAG: EamA family transporter [Phycisphaerae bacterium]|nr:EamA family transporter [Phycisphaerae bacterium]
MALNEHVEHTTTRMRWLGTLVLLCTAMLWSLNGPLIKLLSQAGEGFTGVSGVTIACYRSLFGGVIFLPLALRRWKTLRHAAVGWPIGSVLAFTLMTACFVIATTQTAAANAIVLQYTSPIWVFLASPLLLHERPQLREGFVLVLVMAGVAIIFFGHATSDVPSLLLGLASGCGYGLLTVALRGLRRVDPSTVVALNFLGSGLLLTPAVAIWATFHLTGHQFLLVLLLSVPQFALPYLMFSWALRHVEAHRAALIVLLEVVMNPLLTYVIVGEPVPVPTLIGGPVILVSVITWVLLTWRASVGSVKRET